MQDSTNEEVGNDLNSQHLVNLKHKPIKDTGNGDHQFLVASSNRLYIAPEKPTLLEELDE